MKILLDTSAYVGFKRGESRVVDVIVRSESILVSSIVLGELMFGFRNGRKFDENIADLDRFLQHESVKTIPVIEVTADRYARIAVKLKKRGTPIPTNDIWIAAQTMEHGAELITMDRHFEKISGLVTTIL